MPTDLESAHVWGVEFRSSGPVICPSLRLFSSCGTSFPPDQHDFLNPRSLPRLQTVALGFNRSPQAIDLSALPTSVRVVANCNYRRTGSEVADNTLYTTRFDTLLPDHGRRGSLGDCLRTQKVYHLCLYDVFGQTPDAERELVRALKEEPCLAQLRTLRLAVRARSDATGRLEPIVLPNAGELADLIQARRITIVSLKGWRRNPMEGPMIPPGWA